ncbi:hypothetical protein H920_07987 [Fukomys damarensis]|uniref:Uncharacterized protein n=1 Tax=Fukomys damarensis TaxID=885580 RepID=A0A091DEN1_FUKDA|nr:hypothetical protein H920_07987 [Fukomys damarensis]
MTSDPSVSTPWEVPMGSSHLPSRNASAELEDLGSVAEKGRPGRQTEFKRPTAYPTQSTTVFPAVTDSKPSKGQKVTRKDRVLESDYAGKTGTPGLDKATVSARLTQAQDRSRRAEDPQGSSTRLLPFADAGLCGRCPTRSSARCSLRLRTSRDICAPGCRGHWPLCLRAGRQDQAHGADSPSPVASLRPAEVRSARRRRKRASGARPTSQTSGRSGPRGGPVVSMVLSLVSRVGAKMEQAETKREPDARAEVGGAASRGEVGLSPRRTEMDLGGRQWAWPDPTPWLRILHPFKGGWVHPRSFPIPHPPYVTLQNQSAPQLQGAILLRAS